MIHNSCWLWILIVFFPFLFSTCRTAPQANDEYYPSQCPDFAPINAVIKEYKKTEIDRLNILSRFFNDSLVKTSRPQDRGRKLVSAYRIEDQQSMQEFQFYGFDKSILGANSLCQYAAKSIGEKNAWESGGDCFLSEENLQRLDKFFGKEQCQIKGIRAKVPDKDIAIVVRLTSDGVLSFKYINNPDEKRRLYEILSDIWKVNLFEDQQTVPWSIDEESKSFLPYDPFHALRENKTTD